MNENYKGMCVCVCVCVCPCVHTCTCALLNEVFDASSAFCSKASGASAGAGMDAANFSISVRISECVRGRERRQKEVGGKTEREDKIRNRDKWLEDVTV